MRAGLERYVDGGPFAGWASLPDRLDLCVGPSEPAVVAAPYDLAAAHNHGADHGVRLHLAAPSPSQLEGQAHELFVVRHPILHPERSGGPLTAGPVRAA